jgi:hypothetical protein
MSRRWFVVLCSVALIAVRAWPVMSIVVLGGPIHDSGGIPPDWQVKEHNGRANVSGCIENQELCVHLISQNSSFALEHGVDIDPLRGATDVTEGSALREIGRFSQVEPLVQLTGAAETSKSENLAPQTGFEPRTFRLTSRCLKRCALHTGERENAIASSWPQHGCERTRRHPGRACRQQTHYHAIARHP